MTGRQQTPRSQGRARGCPRHAVAALDGIAGAHIDWADSKGLNQWERKALKLSEERSQLGYGIGSGQRRQLRDDSRGVGICQSGGTWAISA